MPWCHNCETEYREGIEKCPECGAALSDELPPSLMEPAVPEWGAGDEPLEWPLDENGQPVPPARLTTVSGSQLDYNMTLSMLRAFGIPTTSDFPGAGQLVKLVFGFSGEGMDVYVPETLLDDARALLSGDFEE